MKSPGHRIFFEMQFYCLFFGFLAFAILGLKNPVMGQQSKFISHVLEYKPAPGQFINTSVGCPTSAQSLIGGVSGLVSLGGFGGYLVVGFDHTIDI